MFAELFEEDTLALQCAREAGFHWVDTKVAAGSELKGLYARGLKINALTDEVELATLMQLDAQFLSAEEMVLALGEIDPLGAFASHYSVYSKRNSWTALSLRGYADDPNFIIRPDEMSRQWKQEHAALLAAAPRDTVLAQRCPTLMRIAARIPGAKDRIRLMRLRAKDGELTRHADVTLRDAGVADGRIARLHIPLVTNPAVTFKSWDARGNVIEKQFDAGSLFYLDQRKPHAAVNKGGEDRVHLVIDTISTPELRQWIAGGRERLGLDVPLDS